jgi:methylated-DNA-protein-cysteine methyltransferase-like protein
MEKSDLYTRFYKVIQRIPRGYVATYGQIAEMAGYPGYARQVGYALRATPEDLDIPWHRVINAQGKISIKAGGPYDNVQRLMLEAEGIEFDHKNRIPLNIYRWNPHLGEESIG